MTTVTEIRDFITNLSDDALVEAFAITDADYAKARMLRDTYQAEIERRLYEREGRMLQGTEHVVELVPGTPSYDLGSVVALAERVTDEEWEKAYTPAREVRRIEPPKVDGRVLNQLERRYGPNSDVGRIIARARIPGRAKVNVTRRTA